MLVDSLAAGDILRGVHELGRLVVVCVAVRARLVEVLMEWILSLAVVAVACIV